MDQIGLMVTYIDEKGYMRFAPVGGIFPLTCWGTQVRFGDGTVGTVGLDGRAKRSEAPALKDMFIDVGVSSRADVKQKVGDVATFIYPFVAQGNVWFASNHDDRVGCIVLAQLLRELKGAPISHDLYAVFTTQEEVGLRGATTSAYAVDPEIGIALDVTLTGDLPYATPAMEVAMGKGVAIKVQDGGMISHSGLNKLLIAAAEGAGIPYQLEVLMGGTTDARSMQVTRAGVPATCLSIPSRHVHTPSQLVDRRDVEGAVALLKAFLGGKIAFVRGGGNRKDAQNAKFCLDSAPGEPPPGAAFSVRFGAPLTSRSAHQSCLCDEPGGGLPGSARAAAVRDARS